MLPDLQFWIFHFIRHRLIISPCKYQCNSYEWMAIRCIILYLWGWSDQLLQCRHRGSRGRSRSRQYLPSLNSAVLTSYKTDRGFLISPWKVWSVISFHAAVQWYLLELERKVLAKVRNRGEGLLLVENDCFQQGEGYSRGLLQELREGSLPALKSNIL